MAEGLDTSRGMPLVQTGRTYTDRPLIRRVTNEDIEKQKAEEAQKQFEAKQNQPVVSRLASHIRSAFTAAIQAKSTVMQRGLKCLRQREGIYEADIQALIDKQGGTSIYMIDYGCQMSRTRGAG